jgi:hypothetical protein
MPQEAGDGRLQRLGVGGKPVHGRWPRTALYGATIVQCLRNLEWIYFKGKRSEEISDYGLHLSAVEEWPNQKTTARR